MTYNDGIDVLVADASHEKYVDTILKTIADAAKVRGSGIASRTHEYVAQKMRERKAIIALHGEEFAGFCYIESWEDKHYVANSGLIVVQAASPCHTHQGNCLHTQPSALASCKAFRIDKSGRGDEDKYETRLCSRAALRSYAGRRVLEGLRNTRSSLLHQL